MRKSQLVTETRQVTSAEETSATDIKEVTSIIGSNKTFITENMEKAIDVANEVANHEEEASRGD